MAHVTCPECNREISDHAMSCPYCEASVHSGSPVDPLEAASYQPVHLWRAVGITVAVVVLLVVMMDHMAASREARRAHLAHLAVQKAECQRLQAEARLEPRKADSRFHE